MEPPDQPEPSLSPEEVDERAESVLPSGLMALLTDAKWKDRLEGCEKLHEFVDGLPADEMQSLLVVKVLGKKPGWKDSNFQVMKAKFGVVMILVQRAGVFGKKSTSNVLPPLVEKIADVKVKPQCVETLMAIAERMTLNYTALQVMKLAFEHKSPKVHSESLDWLGQALREFGLLINVKPFIDFIKKAFGATNPAVRSAAINLLGVIYMYIGAQLRMFFEDEKPALLQQIDAVFEKVSGESPPAPIRGPNVKGEEEEEEEEVGGGAMAAAKPVSMADLMPKVDISGQIKSELIRELGDKNWKIRGEGLQKVKDILAAAKFIQPSLGDLPGALKARLGDSNKNLIITTLGIIASLATAMGSACSKFTRAFLPATLGVLTDSKPHVRAAAVVTLNRWCEEVTLVPFIEQELLSEALTTENPTLRTELLGWLEETLPSAGRLPSELTAVVPPLYLCLEDRSGEVRKKAQALLPLMVARLGFDAMLKHTARLKPASKQVVKGLLDKHRASAPPTATPTPAPAAPTKAEKPDKTAKVEEEKPAASAQTTKKAGSGKKTTAKGSASASAGKGKSGGKGGEEAAEGAPLVVVAHGKEQRMRDEEKNKTLKWNFTAGPRGEHLEQLKDQLQPCASPALLAQLFHDDFKRHIAALATLTKAVSGDAPHKDAAIGCTDLLLRWITLRFFDTNTTVNLKCLEFLHALFAMLLADGAYRMSDYEANAFLPYLVLKMGDAKDPVRKGVRSLFRDMCGFYPPVKMFSFVLDGLKSKNARQRTECLEELGLLLQNNGMAVCGPSPQRTLPIITGQIADRDNAVRSAALNTMVIVYGNVGETVYKYTTQLSEKEVSLLEERIKRCGKKMPTAAAPTPPSTESVPPPEKKGGKKTLSLKPASATNPSASTPPPDEPSKPLPSGKVSPPLPSQTHAPPSSLPQPSRVVEGPFKLDMKKYAVPGLKPKATCKLQSVDTSVLYEKEIEVPKYATSRLLAGPRSTLSVSPGRAASSSSAVSFIISQITASDDTAACRALRQLEQVMCSPTQRPVVNPHVDHLLRAVLMKMRMNFTTPLANASDEASKKEVMNLGRKLTACLVAVFNEPSLACLAGQETLIEVESDVMGYLVDERLLKLGEEVAQLNRSFNYLMLRVCENSEKTVLFGSLLQVLLKSISADGSPSKLTETTMKCLWKVTKQLTEILPSLKLDQLLREIHLFFSSYSRLVATPTASDTPYRTAKTVLYHLTTLLGSEIQEHLSLVPSQSLVTQYIRKSLAKQRHSMEKGSRGQPPLARGRGEKRSQVDGGGETGTTTEDHKSLATSQFLTDDFPPGAVSTLAEVFKKIASPETTRQGLRELFLFQQSHPNIDLTKFQKGTSPFFRSYIQRGLKSVECDIAAERQGATPLSDSAFANTLVSDDCKQHIKSLQAVRVRASRLMNIDPSVDVEAIMGGAPPSTDSAHPSEDSPALKETAVQDENKSSLSQAKAVRSSAAVAAPKPSGSLNLDEVRRRLERLKGST